MALLSLRGVALSFGGPKLFDGLDLMIEAGERVCLLGRNGEGKSTLLKLITGEIDPDEGTVVRQQGLRIARLPQDVPEGHGGTVADEVANGLAEDDHDFGGDDYRVQSVISRVGLDPDAKFSELSSGMKRRVLLAQAIVDDPDILLLDEPTNHLDIESIRWLESFLLRYNGTIVFVTHDRVFLQRLANRILELDRGRLSDWSCDYETFLVRRDQLLAAEARERDLFDKKLAEEEKWIRKGVEARRTRNEGRVRALQAMRVAHRQRRERQGTARMQAQEASRSGTLVVEAEGVEFGYGDRSIVRDLTTAILRGDKVGVIGPNGAGKTTLLRLLLGQLAPRQGEIVQGTNLEISYFEQLKGALDDEKTVQKNVSDYDMITIDGRDRHILGYLQDFLFEPERSRTLVKYLSGGERSRLLLAKLFTRPSNVMVMDEPTNDLDIETLELLESLLVEYQGTLLLVSHDRAFLNDVVTSTLVVEPDGLVREYEGGYDDYLRQRPADKPAEAKPAAESSAKNMKPAEPPRAKVVKLNNAERKELQTLPAKIEKLETALRELHAAMGDPSFYKQDRDVIAKANAKLQEVERDLAAGYARWEALDAIEG
ncbi:ATP-binding cassette domain-containing protein [Paludisphaera borealis]|uniref:ATP-binding protein Uup n=1 Tax=Paludisphaera borealis TaxID=1387353 RepID=A0A1U7CP59_9BACT|nr:ATP-binding cassette domain-containing protein [Paludisphaera borealis]APW60698.1 ABC transporter ATP-binding protein uup [Paludisphaera borealis]